MSFFYHMIGAQFNPASAFHWVEADYGVSIVSGKAAGATDQSGNGRHWSQAVSGSQAVMGTAANGLPTFQFNSGQFYDIPFPALSTPYAVLIVGAATVFSNRFFFDGLTSTTRSFLYAGATAFVGGAPTDRSLPGGVNAATNLHTLIFNGASGQYGLNGGSYTTFNFGAQVLAGLRVGIRYDGTGGLQGDIQLVAIITDLTKLQAAVEYAKQKYIP